MLASTALVYADALVEPQNDFFFRHRSECEYIDQSFYANGEGGSVSLKEEPGSKKEVATIQNEEILDVSHVYYHNGEAWGVAVIYTPETLWLYGWVPLSQLLLIYDSRAFIQDHNEELEPYNGDYQELLTAGQIVFWKYPGSGIIMFIMQENIEEFIGYYIEMSKDENYGPYISYVYTDEQGRDWGFSGWGGWGSNNSWICLSDPENSEIPAFTENATTSFLESAENNSPKTGISMIWVAAILVALLVAITGILIRIFWKPNKAGQ
ncbi:MAG: hypothetical protein FWH48_02080 [Oscillospiraceae bacterium]|nr:hypothetical protein [Oscillospiraceae bacterium]